LLKSNRKQITREGKRQAGQARDRVSLTVLSRGGLKATKGHGGPEAHQKRDPVASFLFA